MTTTANSSADSGWLPEHCPSWCTAHEDVNRPHPLSEAELAVYDEMADGHWIHCSDEVTINGFEVSTSCCMDSHGRDLETPRVFLDGRDLTAADSHDLAVALLDASSRIEAGQ